MRIADCTALTKRRMMRSSSSTSTDVEPLLDRGGDIGLRLLRAPDDARIKTRAWNSSTSFAARPACLRSVAHI